MPEKSQAHLATQDATTVDPSKLTALTPEVVSSVFVGRACVFVVIVDRRHEQFWIMCAAYELLCL